MIAIYKAEQDSGLEQAIHSNTSVALASVAHTSGPGGLSQQAMARLRGSVAEFAKGDVNDLDLHHLTSVMVSVGWNKNDDVFDRFETWVARHTPEDKQLNYEHNHAKIVGHITASHVMDAEGKVVADDTVLDDLPANFHVVAGGVLYKHWQTPELQQRMDTLIAEIAEGQWFVSMECLFNGFDYVLKDPSGSTRVVAHTHQTAFLTKHLRAYGGTGQYGGEKVGRLLRNIVFSGKGLVRKPANPKSVILSHSSEGASPGLGTSSVAYATTAVAERGLTPAQILIARAFGATI